MSTALGIRSAQRALVLVAFTAVLLLSAGCASRQRYYDPSIDEVGVERSARPIDEEQSLADRIGEVGVVLLVVVVTVGGILLPILLLA